MRKKLTRTQIEEIVRSKLKEKLNEDMYDDGTHVPGTSYTRAEIESGTQLPFQQRLKATDPPPIRPGYEASMSDLGYGLTAPLGGTAPPSVGKGSAWAGSGIVPPEFGGGAPVPMPQVEPDYGKFGPPVPMPQVEPDYGKFGPPVPMPGKGPAPSPGDYGMGAAPQGYLDRLRKSLQQAPAPSTPSWQPGPGPFDQGPRAPGDLGGGLRDTLDRNPNRPHEYETGPHVPGSEPPMVPLSQQPGKKDLSAPEYGLREGGLGTGALARKFLPKQDRENLEAEEERQRAAKEREAQAGARGAVQYDSEGNVTGRVGRQQESQTRGDIGEAQLREFIRNKLSQLLEVMPPTVPQRPKTAQPPPVAEDPPWLSPPPTRVPLPPTVRNPSTPPTVPRRPPSTGTPGPGERAEPPATPPWLSPQETRPGPQGEPHWPGSPPHVPWESPDPTPEPEPEAAPWLKDKPGSRTGTPPYVPPTVKEGSGDRNDKDREQGHGKQRQKAGSDGKKGDLEEQTNMYGGQDDASDVYGVFGMDSPPGTQAPQQATQPVVGGAPLPFEVAGAMTKGGPAGAQKSPAGNFITRALDRGRSNRAANRAELDRRAPDRGLERMGARLDMGAENVGRAVGRVGKAAGEAVQDLSGKNNPMAGEEWPLEEHKSDKEWYDDQLYESLSRKWAK